MLSIDSPSPRARRSRRAVNYDDSEPDEDEEDLELGPPDADDGWDSTIAKKLRMNTTTEA